MADRRIIDPDLENVWAVWCKVPGRGWKLSSFYIRKSNAVSQMKKDAARSRMVKFIIVEYRAVEEIGELDKMV